ncbi:tripartite tricarboxylate transporter substrate-binding protein [Paraburkholderia sediminicola]|uniref:tripartite tricarboxylate transporter substrate-binding protein n=1 Tax=Paraburkholderia sediminicola TaxID=458836 RepID=UPI0038B95D89
MPIKINMKFIANTDAAPRFAAKWPGDELKQSFIVDNRAGANGLLAIQTLKQRKPHGYTLMTTTEFDDNYASGHGEGSLRHLWRSVAS